MAAYITPQSQNVACQITLNNCSFPEIMLHNILFRRIMTPLAMYVRLLEGEQLEAGYAFHMDTGSSAVSSLSIKQIG